MEVVVKEVLGADARWAEEEEVFKGFHWSQVAYFAGGVNGPIREFMNDLLRHRDSIPHERPDKHECRGGEAMSNGEPRVIQLWPRMSNIEGFRGVDITWMTLPVRDIVAENWGPVYSLDEATKWVIFA